MLDLQHRAGVRLVRRPQRLGDHAVEPGALELVEPLLGLGRVGGGAGQVAGAVEPGERLLQGRAPLRERAVDVRLVAEREQVERDERGRRLLGQHVDARLGRVDPLLEHLELEPLGPDGECHEQLAVEHAALGQLLAHRGDDLGEVAGQRLGVAAGQLDLVAVLEHQAAEPVPLGLEAEPAVLGGVRDALDGLREHRLNGRHHGEVHAPRLVVLGSCGRRTSHGACWGTRPRSAAWAEGAAPPGGALTLGAYPRLVCRARVLPRQAGPSLGSQSPVGLPAGPA